MRALERLPGALLALLLAGGLAVGALAKEAAPASANPELEARVTRISAELRCLVCQNQTIADSNAELAVDLRRQVREMLQQGRSEREILDYMTARYGDFVLYNPPLKPSTALLWVGPVLLLVGGMTVLVLILRRRSRMSAEHFDAEPGAGADQPPSDADASPPR
jgi:cytochrome c-type biogenesis protein CcmH